MKSTTLILGLETSCDETAAAIVRRSGDGHGELLANVVHSQLTDHAPFGGVVPEIAARAHLQRLDGLIGKAMADAHVRFEELDAVAATAGPGLLGGLLVAMMEGKAIALARGIPFLAINHLEGHALTPRLLAPCNFPYLLLLISGGHTQFQMVEGVGQYTRLGTTIDDALGEAFDKVAKLLGLGYPGGPRVEEAARNGNPTRFEFPRPLKGRDDCNFSFSGLKTAVRETVRKLGFLSPQDVADVSASFQAAIAETVADRLVHAFAQFKGRRPEASPMLVVAGGVAANAKLRTMLEVECEKAGFTLNFPPFHLCTDNAAMIAWAGAERLALGLTDGLDFAARPRWPLDAVSAPVYGSGRLGAKA
jgi:N6-L-threonylcarbamoyladenine synthase